MGKKKRYRLLIMLKKLIIFHPYLAPYRIDLYNQLNKDYNLYVLLTGSQSEFKTLGFNLSFVNKQAQFSYDYYCKGLRFGRHLLSKIYLKKIRIIKPDIVIGHELGVNTIISILLKKKFGYKLFVTIDDSPAMVNTYSKLRERLRNYIVNRVDGILVANPEVKSYLEAKYTVKTCYLPIIQSDEVLKEKLESAKGNSQYLVNKYQLEGKNVFLFVGRLEEIKNPILLVDTFKELLMESDQSVLVIIGNGSLYQTLFDSVTAMSSNVFMLGQLTGDDLYAWYNLAHIFVLPSNFEPFGAVVNEALIAGCYTIVSDQVGARSLINGSNGYVFKSNDGVDLYKAIKLGLDFLEKNDKTNRMINSFDYFYKSLNNFISNHEN